MHSSCINNNCTTFCYQNVEVPNSNPNNMQQSKKGSEKGSCYTYTTDNLENPDRFNSRVNLENSCLKRSSKKDRHSKIHTARGPRDRRMRLSLDVAKKFFRLQDMLGFDKASNTIEWLIMKSTPAIQDLYVSQPLTQNTGVSVTVSASNSPSSASECEVLDDRSATNKDKAKFSNKNKKVERVERKRVYIDQSFAKETREKARARARKRTSEKRENKVGYVGETCVQYSKVTRPCEVMDQDTNWFGFSIPSVGNQVQLADETEYPSSCFQFKQGIGGDNSAMMSSNWSQSFMFNYLQNSGLNSHDQHQFSEFQTLGKTWEGINN